MAKEPERRKSNSGGQGPRRESDRNFWAEIRAIVFFVLAILLFLAIASYRPFDPGFFSHGNMTRSPRNLVGYGGSYAADLIVWCFGFVGALVPILLLRLGILTVMGRALLRPGRILVWTSLFASLCTLFQWVSGSTNLNLYGQEAPINMGGYLGVLLGALLEKFLGEAGTSILIPLWVFVTLMFLWQISLQGILGYAARPFQSLLESWRVRKERSRQAEKREEARNQVLRKQQERMEEEERRKITKPKKERAGSPPTPDLPFEPPQGEDGYRFPPTNLLDPGKTRPPVDESELMEKARLIERRLGEFDIQGEVVEVNPGPVVTVFEFHPAPGVKYNRVVSLAEDLALSLKTEHVRMDRVGGKSRIGIEVPNEDREIISFRELVESGAYRNAPGKLPIALGKTVTGEPKILTLDTMPHLLVAGTTGSGKSVGINVLIHSILFRSTPDEVKLILIDPKQVELKIYENLPHLMTPVVTDVKKAANALNWAVREMTERYKMLAACKVRTIDQFNQYLKQAHAHTPVPQAQAAGGVALRPLPYIVIVIDELYDLMAAVAKDVETAIARLSAMARAVGIHLILATQRPSRDVITGVIKSNLPARIAFQVRERLESRLILDQNGAETLQGKGDMLLLPPGTGRVMRIHGAFLSTVETQRVINYLERVGEPHFDTEVIKDQPLPGAGGDAASEEEVDQDPLYQDALRLVVETGVASASNLQRKMRIGYARAARILDTMERNGIVGPADGAKPREILVDPSEIGG